VIYSPTVPGGVRVRIYPDEMPLTREEFMTFRNFVTRLSNRSEFKMKRIQFAEEDITQVVSHDHDVLQCLDVVLGDPRGEIPKQELGPSQAYRASVW
jgi:hypothetical protein